MNVDKFSARFEATGRQMGFINSLVKQKNTTLEDVLVKLWRMPIMSAFSDRPWMRLTKREASKVIDHLLAMPVKADAEEAREAYKEVLAEHNEREPDSIRIEHDCPF